MKKTTKKNDTVKTVDCTPTWAGLLPALVELYTKGEPNGRGELERMARIADHHLASNKPEAVREAGREGAKLLECSDRGQRVMDAVQRLLLPSGAGGYGLDAPGMEALADVFRAVSRGCFEGVVQSVPSERRANEEAARQREHPSKPVKYVIFDPKTDRYLDTFDASRKDFTEWTPSPVTCMQMDLHTARVRGHHIADHFGINCLVVAKV